MSDDRPSQEERRDSIGPFADELSLKALSAAFALVAAADLELAESEVERFMELVQVDQRLSKLDASLLEPRFRALVEAIMENPEVGRHSALKLLEACKDDPIRAQRIIEAAQIAVVADARIEESEETTLREIAVALGLDPDTV